MPSQREWPSVVETLLFEKHAYLGPHENRVEIVQNQVLHNLGNLLNTRRRCGRPDSRFKLLSSCIYDYGIPDFTGAGFGSKTLRAAICNDIRDAIRKFEPRLDRPHVRDRNSDTLGRILHFRIEARLIVYPRPQRVDLDSQLDCSTHLFKVDWA